jgi:hypothetical protein
MRCLINGDTTVERCNKGSDLIIMHTLRSLLPLVGNSVKVFHKSRNTYLFFFYMSTQNGGIWIQTSDLHFIKHGLSRLNYLLKM